MIRLFFATGLAIVGVCAGAEIAAAQSPPLAPASPACVYESRSYSDGALICVYRTLMLTCSLDGARPTWKQVNDKSLASVCETASAQPRIVEPQPRPRVVEPPPRRHHRHGIRHPTHVKADRAAKCFVFNGKQYCE